MNSKGEAMHEFGFTLIHLITSHGCEHETAAGAVPLRARHRRGHGAAVGMEP
jgi:hypothetical protein